MNMYSKMLHNVMLKKEFGSTYEYDGRHKRNQKFAYLLFEFEFDDDDNALIWKEWNILRQGSFFLSSSRL